MELNLPILDQLAASTQILSAGIGGGFDLFCGLPLYFSLLGATIRLAEKRLESASSSEETPSD